MIEISLDKTEVNFAPNTIEEEIVQNVRQILSNMVATVPFSRNHGIKADYLDAPINVVQMRMRADIAEKISQDEPRAKVEEIVFRGDAESGYTNPIVRITRNE